MLIRNRRQQIVGAKYGGTFYSVDPPLSARNIASQWFLPVRFSRKMPVLPNMLRRKLISDLRKIRRTHPRLKGRARVPGGHRTRLAQDKMDIDDTPPIEESLMQRVQRGDFRVSVCAFGRFRNPSPRKSESASESIIMFADIPTQAGNVPVVLKMFFLVPNTRGLAYEADIYRKPVTALLHGHTPNLVPFIDFGGCTNYESILQNVANQLTPADLAILVDVFRRRQATTHMQRNRLLRDKLFVLITGRATHSLPLFRWGPSSLRDLKGVILQVIYTLTCMAVIQLAHNDNHLGNILVQGRSSDQRPLIYSDGTLLWQIPRNFRVLLFDWDRAYYKPIGTNPSLSRNRCDNFGQCNDQFNIFRDLYMFMCGLATFFPHEEILAFVHSQADAHITRFITENAVQGQTCLMHKLTPDRLRNHMKTPHEMLRSPFFQEFVVTSIPPDAEVYSLPSAPR
jgi:hypothetical protein